MFACIYECVLGSIIDKDLLLEIITSLLYEDDYSEELKLKIIDAKLSNNQELWPTGKNINYLI